MPDVLRVNTPLYFWNCFSWQFVVLGLSVSLIRGARCLAICPSLSLKCLRLRYLLNSEHIVAALHVEWPEKRKHNDSDTAKLDRLFCEDHQLVWPDVPPCENPTFFLVLPLPSLSQFFSLFSLFPTSASLARKSLSVKIPCFPLPSFCQSCQTFYRVKIPHFSLFSVRSFIQFFSLFSVFSPPSFVKCAGCSFKSMLFFKKYAE